MVGGAACMASRQQLLLLRWRLFVLPLAILHGAAPVALSVPTAPPSDATCNEAAGDNEESCGSDMMSHMQLRVKVEGLRAAAVGGATEALPQVASTEAPAQQPVAPNRSLPSPSNTSMAQGAEAVPAGQAVQCPGNGLKKHERCWYLSNLGQNCADTCSGRSLAFQLAVAQEPIMPELLASGQTIENRGDWGIMECYAPSDSYYHSAMSAGNGSEDPGLWNHSNCELACPCKVPEETTTTTTTPDTSPPCPNGGLKKHERCWYLSAKNSNCNSTCAATGREFLWGVAPSPVTPLLLPAGSSAPTIRSPWAAIECYSDHDNHVNPALEDGSGAQEPGSWSSELCSLACPCDTYPSASFNGAITALNADTALSGTTVTTTPAVVSCGGGGLSAHGRCWYLTAQGGKCDSTCSDQGLAFKYVKAPADSPMVPQLVPGATLRQQHAWASLECFVPNENRFHVAKYGGHGMEDPGRYKHQDCKMACPCDPTPTTTTTTPAGYVPGTPGAPWSLEEILAVKAKIHRAVGLQEAEDRILVELKGWDHGYTGWRDGSTIGKFLRLGFHDCLRYTDGTGGCDGCLDWRGVGMRMDDFAQGIYDNAADGHNNGMKPTVEVLEEIYTNPNFPRRTPPLNMSLKASGKSRADLWALATLVAVEYATETQNLNCVSPGHYSMPKQCDYRMGEGICNTTLPRPFVFRTGRRDCVSTDPLPYKAPKYEAHPDPAGNGATTVDFFRKEFGFNGRETVTILGAHTIGRMHVTHSLFRYTWTSWNDQMFNNQYYRNIVGKPDPFFDTDECQIQPDAFDTKVGVRWVPHVRGDNIVGGPVQWIQEKLVCPNCIKYPDDVCCKPENKPAGAFCTPDNNRANGTVAKDADDNVNEGCEKYRFVNGVDSTALPCEFGLYRKFNVDANGNPNGCPGLELFNTPEWGIQVTMRGKKKFLFLKWWNDWSRVDPSGGNRWGMKTEPICDLNDAVDPPGDLPLHKIFEEYADDNAKFMEHFVPTLEKMLTNGYTTWDLSDVAPDSYTGLRCSRYFHPYDENRYWGCWQENEVHPEEFYLESALDGRVLQMSKNHDIMPEMWTKNPTKESNQLWRWSAEGYLINSMNNQLLSEGGGDLGDDSIGQWRYENGLLMGVSGTKPGRALTRWPGDGTRDGEGVTMFKAAEGWLNQRFAIVPA